MSASEQPAVLYFVEADFPASTRGRPLRNVNLTVPPGRLAWLRTSRSRGRWPVAEAALGLVSPSSGSVHFDGEDWAATSLDRLEAMRGRIGRVFVQQAWISNLNVLENVCLSRRHHGVDPDDEIVGEADDLARRFGLSATPRQRPSQVEGGTLKVAQWIRALLTKPHLLVLEAPTYGAPSDAVPNFERAVRDLLRDGVGALWIGSDEPGDELSGMRTDYEVADDGLRRIGGRAA